MISIFFGIKQQSLLLPYPWTTGVLSAFVVWTIVLKLVLKLHKHNVIRKGLYKSFLHQIPLKDCAKAKVCFIWKYTVSVSVTLPRPVVQTYIWRWFQLRVKLSKICFQRYVTLIIFLVSTGSVNEDELPVFSDFSGNVNWVSLFYSDLKVEI